MSGSNSAASPVGVYGIQGVSSAANHPPGLYEACEWTDLQGNFWLFGGLAGNGMQNTLWKYDPLINEWTWVHGSALPSQPASYGTLTVPSASNTPGARAYGCISVTDLNGDFWLFGGSDAFGFKNDLWRYNIASNMWTWMGGPTGTGDIGTYGIQGVPSTSNIPGARNETAAGWCDNNNNIWLFGGMAPYGGATYNDLWKYNIATGEWTFMKGSVYAVNAPSVYGTLGVASPLNEPCGREVYAHWKDAAGNLWIYGGETILPQTVQHGDLWKYDPAINQWTWMNGSPIPESEGQFPILCDANDTSEVPSQMEDRACWTDTCGNFWLYGGALNYAFTNLWCYIVADNSWIMVEGSGAFPQLPIFGTMGVSSPTNRPGGKVGANAWRDNSGNLWLFGGGNGSSWGDLWRYVPDYDCIGTCTSSPPPPPSDTSLFSVPNVFTPNGDNTNDVFEVKVVGYDSYAIEIYDRWGVQVFHADDASIHWNGTLQNTGSNCSSGTYYYIITLTDQSQVAIRTTGFLTLLR